MHGHKQNFGFLARRQKQSDVGDALASIANSVAAALVEPADSVAGQVSSSVVPISQSVSGVFVSVPHSSSAVVEVSSTNIPIDPLSTTLETVSSPAVTTTADASTNDPVQSAITTSAAAGDASSSVISISSPNAIDSSTETVVVSTTALESSTSSEELSSTSSESSSTVETSSTSVRVQTTSTSTQGPSTQFVTSVASASIIPTVESSFSDTKGNDGPSTSTIIGAVVGVIVGLIAISSIVAYWYKSKSRNDDDHEDIFRDNGHNWDRNAFKRDSNRLDDDDPFGGSNSGGSQYGGHNRDMSYASSGRGQGQTTLVRNNTTMSNLSAGSGHSMAAYMGRQNLPGAQRGNGYEAPRPPSMIQRHVLNTAMAPPLPVMSFGNQGGYNAAMGYQQPGMMQQRSLDRSMSQTSQGSAYSGPLMGAFGAGLQRENSVASNYSQATAMPSMAYRGNGRTSPSNGNPFNDKLSILHEDDSEETFYDPQAGFIGAKLSPSKEQFPSRSGTPTNTNPQQVHYGMARASDGASINYVVADNNIHEAYQGEIQNGSQHGHGVAVPRQGGFDQEWKEGRAKRTLSVRNGGLDDFDEKQRPISTSDAYGGI